MPKYIVIEIYDDESVEEQAKDLRDVAEAYRQGWRGFPDDLPLREEVDFQVVDTVDPVGAGMVMDFLTEQGGNYKTHTED